MAEARFDLVVVGGGPGGYVAAIRAAQLGMKTALVEREHLGGICLNWGCIPTKALLRSAEVLELLRHAAEFGLACDRPRFDLGAVVKRSRAVAERLSRGVAFLLKKNAVTVFEGHGGLAGRGRVRVRGKDGSERTLAAGHVLLATGARPRVLPGLEPDGRFVWTYKEAMVPEELPRSLLVVGSGAIGMEFASFYRALGSAVTVVEVLPRVLPAEDEEISAFVHKAFEKRGIRLLPNSTVEALAREANGVRARIRSDGRLYEETFERAILAVGIVGNVEDLGLEDTKVRVEKGHILVDGYGRTEEPGVCAIGDVAGPPWLAHKASHEGVICVETIAGVPGVRPLDRSTIPACTYCTPQVASVGLTEAQAKARGHEVRVGRFPFVGNGKALALGEPEGLVKTVFDAATGELLGAHMVGAEVTEMIQGFALARAAELTESELAHTVFPHPTISETMHEAVLAAFGRALHI
ncbi:MAG: dihydrolipoyl dehydrogenase [Geminicoccaceae bacterium]|nr:dihydrolipoyl dehydrogenase [Geminicoccaceae bacterium]